MKKLSILLLFIPIIGMGQDVSEKMIKTTLAQKFPGHELDEYWETGDGNFEVSIYNSEGEPKTVFYSHDLKWLRTETNLSTEELPAVVTKSVLKAFPDSDPYEIYLVENGSESFYKMMVEQKDASEVELTVNASGSITGKKTVSADEDFDDE